METPSPRRRGRATAANRRSRRERPKKAIAAVASHARGSSSRRNSSNNFSGRCRRANPGARSAHQSPNLRRSNMRIARNRKQVIVQKVREARRDRQYQNSMTASAISNASSSASIWQASSSIRPWQAIVRRDEMLPRECSATATVALYFEVRARTRGRRISLRTHPHSWEIVAQEVPEIYDARRDQGGGRDPDRVRKSA